MVTFNHCGGTSVRRTINRLWLFTAAAGLALLAFSSARADTVSPLYQAGQMSMSGNIVGLPNVHIPNGSDLIVEGLTDNGVVTFAAAPTRGLLPSMLFQFAGGAITPIVFPGGSRSPNWPLDVYWPNKVGVDQPVSVNESGNVVFSVDNPYGTIPWATYWWDAGNQTATKVVLAGEPATGSLVFTKPGGIAPAINNRDEIALIGQVHNPSGPGGYGLFFLSQFPGANSVLEPVVLPGEPLPMNASGLPRAVTTEYFLPSIDDTGRIAFLTQLQGTSRYSAYVHEYGGNVQVMISTTYLRSGARIMNVSSVALNNRDRTALVTATTNQMKSNQYGLYRAANNGVITPIVEPGATMPGGGTLQSVQYTGTKENSPPVMAVSAANAAGQHAFVAAMTDGSTGVYRLDLDGTITPVFQTSPTTGPVQITDTVPGLTFLPGTRPCINNQGQIALSMRRSAHSSIILVLTPAQP